MKSVVECNHYGIMFCPSTYGVMVNDQCVLYTEWSRYTDVEEVLWSGEYIEDDSP